MNMCIDIKRFSFKMGYRAINREIHTEDIESLERLILFLISVSHKSGHVKEMKVQARLKEKKYFVINFSK